MKALPALAAAVLAALSLEAGAVGRLADVSIVDRSSGRELPVYWHEGQPYVVGKPGAEYKVTIRNQRGEDLLAVVSVDGVNVVNGQTASPDQGGYVMSPWRTLDIQGWRKSLRQTASFYFTSLGDSYAGRTGRPDDVGVIGVALFQRARHTITTPLAIDPPHRREKSEASASDNAAEASKQLKRHAPGAAAAPSAPLGTGHGREETSHARLTEFERATRHPAEVIAIRYDSRANLVAMGVIPPTYGRRDPNPFPQAFVPDPPRYRW